MTVPSPVRRPSLPEARRLRALHTVPADVDAVRLDVYASQVLDVMPSRKSAYKAFKRGDILVDGVPSPPNAMVAGGQELMLLDSLTPTPVSGGPELRVVIEDDWLAVVEKPAGIPVMDRFRHSVEQALPGSVSPSPCEDALAFPKPVHRLDVPTGGLVLCAKTAHAIVALSRAFASRQVRKRYRAIVTGLLVGEGTVCLPVDGRDAHTRYAALEPGRSLHSEWVTPVDLWPRTGRTHQLRQHLVSLGHAIVGDTLYGRPGDIFRGKGLFLWAVELGFMHPADGTPVSVQIPPPAKFAAYLAREQRRWQRYHT